MLNRLTQRAVRPNARYIILHQSRGNRKFVWVAPDTKRFPGEELWAIAWPTSKIKFLLSFTAS